MMHETEFSTRSTSALPDSFSSLRNAETFNAYCADVKARLAEHAVHRRQFLQGAHEKLTGLLYAARVVEDEALSQELSLRLTAVGELLDALDPRHLVPSSTSISVAVSSPVASVEARPASPVHPNVATNGFHPETATPLHAPSLPTYFPTNQTANLVPTHTPLSNDSAIARLPRRPVRPLPDIEAEAIQMRGDLHEWSEKYPLVTLEGNLSVPNALRLRAIACRQRRLEEEAGDTEVPEVMELGDDIEVLMDDSNDVEYTVALDYELDPLPTAYQWGELAERYEEMAHAYDAFEWWNKNWTDLTVQEVQPLAEAVAAIQQRFNRLLFRIGARDPYQQLLFDDLRTWAREAQCYLHSLRPKVPIAELIERAATLIPAWDNARSPVAQAQERSRFLDKVERMVSEETFGAGEETDELRLHNLLLECREAKIPPSDRRLRDALLPWSAFLEGEERFREILRDVNLEWERRQEAERPEDYEPEPPEALLPLQEELAAVREVTRGKRLVLLGGTPREDVRQKIEETFEFAHVEWIRTRPEATASDFVDDLHGSDAVGIFTRFSRKEWRHVEEIARQEGRNYWTFTSRYHPSHLVKILYRDEIVQQKSLRSTAINSAE